MSVEDVANELCYKFYFGWMAGYNDLAKSLGMTAISGEAVKKKADKCIGDFMKEAKEIVDKMNAIN